MTTSTKTIELAQAPARRLTVKEIVSHDDDGFKIWTDARPYTLADGTRITVGKSEINNTYLTNLATGQVVKLRTSEFNKKIKKGVQAGLTSLFLQGVAKQHAFEAARPERLRVIAWAISNCYNQISNSGNFGPKLTEAVLAEGTEVELPDFKYLKSRHVATVYAVEGGHIALYLPNNGLGNGWLEVVR